MSAGFGVGPTMLTFFPGAPGVTSVCAFALNANEVIRHTLIAPAHQLAAPFVQLAFNL